ncbi:MAG: hypothetical protein SFV51_26290 [Bryobacteraceae bacterium]|nr:hypothetical protein [Bryobacteraceae bacterium]
MKKPLSERSGAGGLKPEYRFDYTNAKPNRFAGKRAQPVIVAPDPNVAGLFNDSKTSAAG